MGKGLKGNQREIDIFSNMGIKLKLNSWRLRKIVLSVNLDQVKLVNKLHLISLRMLYNLKCKEFRIDIQDLCKDKIKTKVEIVQELLKNNKVPNN